MIDSLATRFGRRIRLGIVGGGLDSLIGPVHQISVRADNRYELVAGVLSSEAKCSAESAAGLLLDPERCYENYEQMAEREAQRDDGIEVICIVTPPHLHATMAQCFMDRGINVISEKPLCRNGREAAELKQAVDASGLLFALTHNYTGYPMVREARARIKAGAIGAIRQVECDFTGNARLHEADDPAQRSWRSNLSIMGKGVMIGELGTHAFNLAHFVTGKVPAAVSANMRTLAAGREFYDDVQITVRYADDMLGRSWISYVATGNEHGLGFRIYGTEGSLVWHHHSPENLLLQPADAPAQLLRPAHRNQLTPEGLHASRIFAGHPEGYVLAFANLYRDFADRFMARALDAEPNPHGHFPTVDDGVVTMRLFDAALLSNERAGAWIEV